MILRILSICLLGSTVLFAVMFFGVYMIYSSVGRGEYVTVASSSEKSYVKCIKRHRIPYKYDGDEVKIEIPYLDRFEESCIDVIGDHSQ